MPSVLSKIEPKQKMLEEDSWNAPLLGYSPPPVPGVEPAQRTDVAIQVQTSPTSRPAVQEEATGPSGLSDARSPPPPLASPTSQGPTAPPPPRSTADREHLNSESSLRTVRDDEYLAAVQGTEASDGTGPDASIQFPFFLVERATEVADQIRPSNKTQCCCCSFLPPAGDMYFQNIRSRTVIVLVFVFAFNLAANCATSEVAWPTCFFLLLFYPTLCATFPGTSGLTLVVGWLGMSAFHGIVIYGMLLSYNSHHLTPRAAYDMSFLGACMVQHQAAFLSMGVSRKAPENEVSEALGDARYVGSLFPLGDGKVFGQPRVEDVLRATAADYDPLFPARYSTLRIWIDSIIDLPFVCIPPRKNWSLPTLVSNRTPPLRLPVPYVIAQVCTITTLIQAGSFLFEKHSTSDNGSNSSNIKLSDETLQIAVFSGGAVCLISIVILTVQMKSAARDLHFGRAEAKVAQSLSPPWRVHNYIGIQCFTNLALFVMCYVLVLIVGVFMQIPDAMNTFGKWVAGSVLASWFSQLLQRVLFARWLSDKTSVKEHRKAVTVGHIITLMSIIGGPGAVLERFLFLLLDVFLSFARPLNATAISFPFLDHLYRSLWALVYLNNDCANPVKQTACAVLLAEAEMEQLRRLSLEADAAASGVPLLAIGKNIYLPHIRHTVRALVAKRLLGATLATAEGVLSRPDAPRIILPLTSVLQSTTVQHRRAQFRWRLAVTLSMFPQLQALRKGHLWSTTFAVPPLHTLHMRIIAEMHRH
jgi:hypothetical protein